jgi:DNA-binding protein HU-beta
MTKASLIKELAGHADITQAAASAVLNALVDIITDQVKGTGRIELTGLGVFKIVARAACERPHPQKRGEKVQVLAHNTVKFRPSPTLKEAVNQ